MVSDNGKYLLGFGAGILVGGLIAAKVSSKRADKEESVDGISLYYWNGRGLMEVPRMLLAANNKFPPADYDDGRYSTDDSYGPVKSYDLVKDKMDCNMGRMPVMSQDGKFVGQSVAINYYIAKQTGMMGANDFEAAQIISLQEHLRECMESFRKLIPYGNTPAEDELNTWFDTGATDSNGPADMKARKSRFLKWYVGRIENCITGSDGYAVGSDLSLADLLIYNMFAEVLAEGEAADSVKGVKWRREPFASLERTNAALKSAPKIQRICETVRASPGIKQWLNTRGEKNKQRF